MELKTLINLIEPVHCTGSPNHIASLAMHTSEVRSGDIFVALPSVWQDKPGGEQYINQALTQGASVILSVLPAPEGFPSDRCWLQVQDAHEALSKLAKAFYPLQPKNLMAVTGTNGKTSVADFTFQLWRMAGFPCARMGTIGVKDSFGHDYGDNGYTMPNATTLHKTVHGLASEGVEYLALEASSHAIVQHRMDNLEVSIAAFTNLTHEHLDYHGDMENYFHAKSLLFSKLLSPTGTAIINRDDPVCGKLEAILAGRGIRTITYGTQKADICANITSKHEDGQDIELSVFGRDYHVQFPLIGHFQVSNAMCALANAIISGADETEAVAHLSQLHSVPGRLQKVGNQVYVDYAHTPDALETALKALRPHTKGRLLVVFGCGGNRDSFKRPVMGKIASDLADVVYITDDNPRLEDPTTIRQQILVACSAGLEFESRQEAIHQAIEDLKSGDILLIAGKGHETGQIIGTDVQPFNDVTIAEQALGIMR